MKSRKRQEAWGWLVIFFLLTVPVWAEGTERVKVTGIKRAWGNTEKKISFLEGDLIIIHENTKIKTSYAELNQEKKEGTFSKGVVSTQKDITVESRELYVNFKKKKGVFTNGVHVVRVKSEDAKGQDKEPFTLKCDRLEMDTDKEDFIATGNMVRLEHEDFVGQSRRMEYNNEQETLVMTGNPVLERKKGESVKGDRILINMKNETFEVLENAEIEFGIEDDDDEK